MLKLILLYIIQVGVSPWFGLGAANLARALDRMEPSSDPPSSPRALPDAQRAPIPPDLPHTPVPAMHAAPSHSHPPSSSVFTCLCDVWGRGTGVCASSLPNAGNMPYNIHHSLNSRPSLLVTGTRCSRHSLGSRPSLLVTGIAFLPHRIYFIQTCT